MQTNEKSSNSCNKITVKNIEILFQFAFIRWRWCHIGDIPFFKKPFTQFYSKVVQANNILALILTLMLFLVAWKSITLVFYNRHKSFTKWNKNFFNKSKSKILRVQRELNNKFLVYCTIQKKKQDATKFIWWSAGYSLECGW